MKKCLCIILCFASLWTYAQTDSVFLDKTNLDIEQFLENAAENEDEQGDISEITEELQYLLENKMNLNNPDYRILTDVLRLSRYQIYNLRTYLETYGRLYSIYELLLIDGFDTTTLQRINPYITIENQQKEKKLSVKDIFKRGHQTVLMKYGQIIEKQQGYLPISEEDRTKSPNSRYLGSPQALMLKYKFKSSNRLQFGFTMEKDAGEPFFRGKNKYGFDFYSAHLKISDLSVFKTLVFGDYQLNFGQGLCINMGFSMSNSVSSISADRQGYGIKAYSSANENNYLRGIATTIDCKYIDLTVFYSYKNLDATYVEDTASQDILFVENLYNTGYHRTINEMSKKNAIHQHLVGGHIDYRLRIAQLGLTACYTRFQSPLDRTLKPYNQFSFNGIDNVNVAADYNVLVKKVNFYGEIAMSKNLAVATINSVDFQIHPRFTMTISHRYYGRNYQSLYSGAFGENADNSNEHGLYIGYQCIIGKNWQWNTCFNYFHFPWLKYNIDAPSSGFGLQTQLTFSPLYNFNGYLQVKIKNKDANGSTTYYNEIGLTQRQSYRLHLNWSPMQNLSMKTRLEVVNALSVETTKYRQGYLLYQDIKYSIKKIPLSFAFRYAFFDTYSYNERVYAMEDDVLFAYSVPSLYGKGCRVYLLTNVEIGKYVNLWFKIAQTYFRNKSENGSGLSKIDRPTKTDVKVQLQVKW